MKQDREPGTVIITNAKGELIATMDPYTGKRRAAGGPWTNDMPACSAMLDTDDAWERIQALNNKR